MLDAQWYQDRLAELQQQELAAIKQLAAIGGALQFCRFALDELNKQESASGEGSSPEAKGDDNGNS